MNHKIKEPPVRVVKRPFAPLPLRLAVSVSAAVLATAVVCIFISAVSGFGLGQILKVFAESVFSTSNRFLAFARDMILLLMVGVALAPAFKMRFWNIGAQGQILMGGIMTAICMYYIRGKLPASVLIPLMLVSAVLMAGLWCLIPAFCKVRFGANETLFTLMMNYIAIQIVYCFTHIWKGTKSAFGVMDRFTGSRNGYLSPLFGIDIGWTLLLGIVFTVLMYFYLARTKHGYEIAVVGESINTARYAGINDRWVILRTAFISGAICGLVGFLYVSNVSHTISDSTGGGNGFTAIIVAWLGNFQPAVMALISAILTFLAKGAGEVQNLAGLDKSVSDVVVCIFLFFILGSTFFTRYKLVFSGKRKEAEETAAAPGDGPGKGKEASK